MGSDGPIYNFLLQIIKIIYNIVVNYGLPQKPNNANFVIPQISGCENPRNFNVFFVEYIYSVRLTQVTC